MKTTHLILLLALVAGGCRYANDASDTLFQETKAGGLTVVVSDQPTSFQDVVIRNETEK